MAKTENNQKKITKKAKMKLNLNYIDFIAKVISENLVSNSRDELANKYIETVKVRSFRNISRVDSRVKREELKAVLAKELESRKISQKDFQKVSEQVVQKLSKKSSNFVAI